jgi:hypothetical protein
MPNVPTQEEFQKYLLEGGASPVVELSEATSPAPGGAPGGSAQGFETPTSFGTPGAGAQPAGGASGGQGGATVGQGAPIYGGQGTTAERILNPIGQQTQQVGQQTQQAGQEFRAQAGPTGQTFDSRGGGSTLFNYVDTGQGKTEAQGLVDNKYTGPTAIDPSKTADIRANAQDAQTLAGAAREGSGVRTVLQVGAGLNSGAARQEAQDVFQTPGYREAAAKEAYEANMALTKIAQEETQARNYAGRRQTEEQRIQDRARGLLGLETKGLDEGWDARVEDEKARVARMEDAWAKFEETGDSKYLLDAGMELPEAFAPVNQGRIDEASTLYDEIMGKYPDISEYGPLVPGITGHGQSQLGLMIDDPKTFVYDPTWRALENVEGIPHAIRRQLRARQAELEAQFGDLEEWSGKEGGKDGQAAAYSDVAPLYYGREYAGAGPGSPKGATSTEFFAPETPVDMDPYYEYQGGVAPTRENLATEAERGRYNRANELLQTGTSLPEATVPYEGPSVTADEEAFKGDQAMEAQASQQALEEAAAAYNRQVRKARQSYQSHKGGPGFMDIFGYTPLGAAINAGGKLLRR